ncbi:MAG: hypothetical protein DYG94_01325 [Leptolyngbya sp. PLA3]|nr:MAG: hypothetical protein EDM82_00555 [Cyanobacteria bacterium CYA]MCE7967372.1 hypothetical protein [Leptolyngbya sp. PL-A3]
MRSIASDWLACVLMLAGAPAAGQLLDLGGNPAPVIDTSTAASELASFLEAQSTEIALYAQGQPPLTCAASLRSLAAALLRDGQQRGEEGAGRLLAARTLVRLLPDLDAALTEGHVPTPMARLAAEDLSQLASSLPGAQATLDRALRDALAPLTNSLVPAHSPPPLASLAAAAQNFSGVDPAPFARLDELVAAGLAWPSHAPSAARTHDAVARAMRVLAAPGWLPAQTRQSLAASLTRAVTDLADRQTADVALLQIDHIALLADLIAQVDALHDGVLRRATTARVATLAHTLETDPGGAARSARALLVVFSAPGPEVMERMDPWMPTAVRVALGNELKAVEEARQRLLSVGLELQDRSDPMVEPALLSALRGHRQARQSVLDLFAIGAMLTGEKPIDGQSPRSRPRVLREFRRLSTPLLEAGRDLTDPAKANQARAFIASLAGIARTLEPFPGEPGLRDAGNPGSGMSDSARALWNALTGDRAGDLLAQIDQARQQVRTALGEENPVERAADAVVELERLHALLRSLDAAHDVLSGGLEAANTSACLELSEHAWNAGFGETTQRAADATASVLQHNAFAEADFRLLRLVALIPTSKTAAQFDALLHLGSIDESTWPGRQRAALAAICRNLEELASARLRGETERATRLEDDTRSRATHVLETIASN